MHHFRPSLPSLPVNPHPLPSSPFSPSFSYFLVALRVIFSPIMFRSAIVRSLRAAAPRAAVKTPAPFQIRSSPLAVRTPQFTPGFVSQSIRCYSAPAGLSKDEVEGRIVNLLKNFDKVRQMVMSWNLIPTRSVDLSPVPC